MNMKPYFYEKRGHTMREKINFDKNWLFHKGDIEIPLPKDKGPIYTSAKTERMHWGPASRFYNAVPDNFSQTGEFLSEKWMYVDLPHDYIIKETPVENENNTLGFFHYENAWYRKHFALGEDDRAKRITLLFDGIATHATVYLNGCLLKHNFCGYNSFEVDITDYAKFGGEENVLAVYVKTYGHEGWWYEGAGIYRHVWLCKTDSVSVDLWGVYAAPQKGENDVWNVKLETTVRNDRYRDEHIEIETFFIDQNNCTVAKATAGLDVPLREKKTAVYSAKVINPALWDTETPHLYTVKTVLKTGGTQVDEYTTKTGFRTFEFKKDKGLFLNGRPVKIKGVCAHQDFGLTGKAVSDNIFRYRVELIKEMGANGYRTSHYPHTEATMDALDAMGFIVMDEVRWFESTEEGMEQLEMLVKRDRNRPGVLFWSIGNEEPHHTTEEGRRICKSMMARVRKLDSTRFVMTAVSNDPQTATVYDELDAIGVNYNLDKYEEIHSKYPDKPIFASECCATSTTRGWYDDDSPENGYFSAYDKDTTKWFLGREKTWKFLSERDWIVGGYQWTAFEHRGETQWPRLCSQAGAIDLYLQKKDAFYQNQALWIEERPVVHLLPHWNFAGREGERIKVVAYTNCEEVELFLNGKSQGLQRPGRYGHGEWNVPYEAGQITVHARCGGKTVCTDTRETTGQAKKLNMVLENKIDTANGEDVALIRCFCTDEAGREVPDAQPFVEFCANRLGSIIGTGSDVCDHVPPHIPSRKMRAGCISVAVKVGQTAGDLKVYAKADGLVSSVVTIPLKQMEHQGENL